MTAAVASNHSSYALPHPPARRPSNLRRTSSSSSVLLSPVPRFSPEATTIPAPIYNKGQSTSFDGQQKRPSAGQPRCSFSGALAGAGTSPPAERPALPTLGQPSLLQRRKSSAASQSSRPNFTLTTLTLDDLPNPVAKLPAELERLDDTVPKEVIGMSSAAVTPETPGEGKILIEERFKPTKSRKVGTPFPEKRSYLDEEEDDDDDEGSEDDEVEGVKEQP